MTGKQQTQLRILLMQAREDEVTQREELLGFARFTHLQPSQFTPLDLFATPDFPYDAIQGYDALFVGGSSDASVLQPQRFPFIAAARQLLVHCVKTSVPVFASCFGFQLVVEALGGKVIEDRQRMELGTFALQLTPAAREDLLFHDLPEAFPVIAGHKERALELPAGMIHLGATVLCPYHAITLPGKPFYGFQFHPEMDRADLINRLTRYHQRYLEPTDAIDKILAAVEETPIANQLLERFVQRILLAQP